MTDDILAAIKPGVAVVYHVGHLARDRQGSKSLDVLASNVWRLYLDRRATLVQRLVPGDERDVFEYIAVGCMPPLHKQSGLGPRSFRSGVAFLS